jgi:hypothetical protein
MVLTKMFNKRDEIQYTEMEIRSRHIKAALQAVAPNHPSVNFKAQKVVMRGFARQIFHYQDELRQYGKRLQDPIAAKHVNFILQYLYRTLSKEMRDFQDHVQTPLMLAPGLEFEQLWMAFCPGDFVYHKTKFGENVWKFLSMERCECTVPWCYLSRWQFTLQSIEYDGDDFGLDKSPLKINPYTGYKPFTELDIIPLRYHPQRTSIRARLVARGKKLVSLHGFHHREYSGKAEALSETRTNLMDEDDEGYPVNTAVVCTAIP